MMIDGKKIRAHLKEELRAHVAPGSRLDIVYVGYNKAIEQYVSGKQKFGRDMGIEVVLHQFADMTTEKLVSYVHDIVQKGTNGIIIQLPLPANIDRTRVLNAVPVELDVDILSEEAQKKFFQGDLTRLPPVVGACKAIIDYHHIDLQNKKIVILGNGALVGLPLSIWLTHLGFSFTQLNRENFDAHVLQDADVIFSGIGVPHFVTSDMVKDGVMVFDAGTTEDKETVLGDVDPRVADKASYFTPIPGGIGPLTIVAFFTNLIHRK